MITVIETKDGFERIGGNPTLTSLDGEIRAPLAVIIHKSWTARERAGFGIHQAAPFTIPEGKQAAGYETFERVGGKLDIAAELDALSYRVAALEAGRTQR